MNTYRISLSSKRKTFPFSVIHKILWPLFTGADVKKQRNKEAQNNKYRGERSLLYKKKWLYFITIYFHYYSSESSINFTVQLDQRIWTQKSNFYFFHFLYLERIWWLIFYRKWKTFSLITIITVVYPISWNTWDIQTAPI